ncbi:MAG TPA: SDR family oxidoreductase [Candidatus Bathyarchaeia archaeon]|nr:SDR family oxidoreductase [Candidatus Bathyarchaeia archaeon]
MPAAMPVTTSLQISGLKLLDGKVAVVYGAGGGVGSSVAKAFAREGARVFLAGRSESKLSPIAEEIKNTGKFAEVAKVDALDPQAVETHLQTVVNKTGKLDISFNLIGTNVAMGSKLTELSDQRFMDAAFNKVKSYFITMTAAARIMEKQGMGVILALTAPNARLPRPNMGGFSVQGAAIEALCRQLAFESGPRGVRVVCLRTGGTPDNPVLTAVFTHLAKLRGTTFEKIAEEEAKITALKRAPLLPEVANAAVLIASDYASAITATTANASCGELVD